MMVLGHAVNFLSKLINESYGNHKYFGIAVPDVYSAAQQGIFATFAANYGKE